MEGWREFLRKATKEQLDKQWNFEKFKVLCSKCGSTNVEVNGVAESELGYYEGEHSLDFAMLIKCHACGNAMMIKEIYNTEIDFSSGRKE